jgi:hypothetical protein
VIHEVSRALRQIVRNATGAAPNIKVVFEAPTKEWAKGLDGTPTIDFCLYDVREDKEKKRVGRRAIYGDDGRLKGYAPPPRWYKLSYIGSAWTAGGTEKDQELLGWLLTTFSGMERIPVTALTGVLAESRTPCTLTVAQPAADARPTPQSLTALSGEVRPTIDLIATVPIEYRVEPAAGLVLEPLILDAHARTGRPQERVQRRRDRAGLRELETGPPGMPSIERSRSANEDDDLTGQPRHELEPG